jgi:CRISPR system Cascade subunit CasC
MNSRTFIDVHVIQTIPPANVNRDDTGSPKSARYGGVRRARVSSQSWKRATRRHFSEHVPAEQTGVRTRRLIALIAERLEAGNPVGTDEATRLAAAALRALGLSTKAMKPAKEGKEAKVGKSEYLMFVGNGQVDRIAAALAARAAELAGLSDKQLDQAVAQLELSDLIMEGHPLDVALFGRMVADKPGLNVDAACQVAHALSTHEVHAEFDYFTAVDDQTGDDESGAAMIGTVEFNAATMYRYATIAPAQLADTLGDPSDAVAGITTFLDAFVRSMPTGHQNSFAHRTLPEFVLVAVRDDQPMNLVGAFERPVGANGAGYSHSSVQRLIDYAAGLDQTYGHPPLAYVACAVPEFAELATPLASVAPWPDVLRQMTTVIYSRLDAKVGEPA